MDYVRICVLPFESIEKSLSIVQEIKPKQHSGERGGDVGTKETVGRGPRNEKNNNQAGSMSNTQVRLLKDQLIRAKVYLSLTATRNNAHFIRELRQRIKEVQRALGDATKDSELPRKYVFLYSKTRCGELCSVFSIPFSVNHLFLTYVDHLVQVQCP